MLCKEIIAFGCVAIGSKDLPFCLILADRINDFAKLLHKIYPQQKFSFNTQKALAIVWITGFKPRGDDSRPDRGLTPLARMMVGEDTEVLVIVSGPAKQATWQTLQTSPGKLAAENGLWQSILNLCDYVFVDSATCGTNLFHTVTTKRKKNCNPVFIPCRSGVVDYSEQDTDTAIHQLFAHREPLGIYECMCNPPGGDWSGVDVYDKNGNVFRWTSLPRVSTNQGKRPDHVIQLPGNVLLTIESKRIGRDLEDSIGINLKTYIGDLFNHHPTACKTPNVDWRRCKSDTRQTKKYPILSAGAFIYSNAKELPLILQRCQLDAVFAFEFGTTTTLHFSSNTDGANLISIVQQVVMQTQGIKIQVH